MRTFAAHVSDGHNGAGHELALNVQIPLLHIGPDGLSWNGVHCQRKRHALSANAGVANHVVLRRSEHVWRCAFERFRVALVSIGVLKEYSISAANGSLTVAEGIVSETDAWSRIEQVTLHASSRDAADAALDYARKRISAIGNNGARLTGNGAVDVDLRRGRQVVDSRIEIVRLVQLFTVGAEQAQPESQIQREFLVYAPVVLHIRLHNLV